MERGSILVDAKGQIQAATGNWWAFPFSFLSSHNLPPNPIGLSLPGMIQTDFARAILSSLTDLSGTFQQTIHVGFAILLSGRRESWASVFEPQKGGKTRLELNLERIHPFSSPISFRLTDQGMPGIKCCLLCRSIHPGRHWHLPERIDLKLHADQTSGATLLSPGLCETCKAAIAGYCRTDRRYGFGPWPGRYSNEPA